MIVQVVLESNCLSEEMPQGRLPRRQLAAHDRHSYGLQPKLQRDSREMFENVLKVNKQASIGSK